MPNIIFVYVLPKPGGRLMITISHGFPVSGFMSFFS